MPNDYVWEGVLYCDSDMVGDCQEDSVFFRDSQQKIRLDQPCEEQLKIEVCRAEYPTSRNSTLNQESIQLLEALMEEGQADEIFLP